MSTTEQLIGMIRSKDNVKVFHLLERMDLEAVNGTGFGGNTPLHAACHFKNQQALVKLVDTPGVNLNQKNKLKQTPLQIAVGNKNHQAVEKLLDTPGINPNRKSKLKETPLHIAVRANNLQAVEKLVKTPGINVNVINSLKETPLHLATQVESAELVAKLLAVPGINANLRDWDGKTPVMIAASFNNSELLELLVNDINVDIEGLRLDEMIPESQQVIQEGRRKRKSKEVLANDNRTKKRKVEQDGEEHGDRKDEERCDPDEVRNNIRKQLIGKIDQVNEKREVLKQTMNRNAENLEKDKKDLNGKQDEEKKKLEEIWRRNKKEMLERHTEEQKALDEKYKDEESQQAFKDLSNTSKQLGEDLKKLDMDPNDIKKLEKIKLILECPICMEIMLPPTRIWMCSGGHNLCENCKELQGNLCPTCRTEKVANRNLGMEEVAASAFD